MRLDPDHDLSPQAIAALRDLLRDPARSEEDLSDERLESFVLGTASKASRRETVRALVGSRASRLRLTRLRDDLLQAGRRFADGVDSPQADVLAHGVSHALGLNEIEDAWNADPDWTALDERAPSNLRPALKAIGRSLSVLLAAPRYAAYRHGAAPSAAGLDTASYAELDDAGTLTVDVAFGPSASIDSHEARLDLLDPAGGSVRLANAPIEHRMARFVLKGFGSMLGLEAGSLPSHLFWVAMEGDAASPSRPGLLLAEDDGSETAIHVEDHPVWNEGTLSVVLGLPPALRERRGCLELFVRAGSVDVVLHSRPLSDFGENAKTIRVPIEGRGGPRAVCGSLLRARILQTDHSTGR